jgi:hypothetical protein
MNMKSVDFPYLSLAISIVGALISIFSFIWPAQERTQSPSRFAQFLCRILSKLYVKIIVIVITVVAVVVFVAKILPLIFPYTAPTPPPTVTITVPTPDLANPNTIPLNKENAFRYEADACFFNEWAYYDKLSVDGIEAPVGIGIMIPASDARAYSTSPNNDRVAHREILEYKLCRNYKELNFSFGVDDDSMDGFGTLTPACTCRMLIQYVNSGEVPDDDENVLYEENNIRYNYIKHAVTMDVSEVEIIRFTFFWDYDTNSSLHNDLKLVLISPTLTAKSS